MPTSRTLRVLLFSPLLCVAAFAQQPAPASPAGSQVRLDVVVSLKNDVPIGGLRQSDFTVFDNKVPQTITSFREAGKDIPVEVILVLDAVNTPFSTVSFERQQIDRYLTSNGGKLAQLTTLAILTEDGVQAQGGVTRDGNALAHDLDGQTVALRAVGRSAGFYGAEERLDISLKSLSLLVSRESGRPGRKLLLFISPGWPALSGVRVDLSEKNRQSIFAKVVDLSTQLRQARVTMYCINPLGTGEDLSRENYYLNFVKGVTRPNETDAGDLSLQVLAVQTGGLVLQGSNDTATLLQHAVDDASPFYELTYASPPAEGPNEYHAITIKTNQPGQVARTRQGYYAQPAPQPGLAP